MPQARELPAVGPRAWGLSFLVTAERVWLHQPPDVGGSAPRTLWPVAAQFFPGAPPHPTRVALQRGSSVATSGRGHGESCVHALWEEQVQSVDGEVMVCLF